MRAGPACPQQSRRGRSFPPGTTYSIFTVGWDEICFLYAFNRVIEAVVLFHKNYCKTLQIVLFKLKIRFPIFFTFWSLKFCASQKSFFKDLQKAPFNKNSCRTVQISQPSLSYKITLFCRMCLPLLFCLQIPVTCANMKIFRMPKTVSVDTIVLALFVIRDSFE